eukprot:1161627-Pelagomonas_calceolata.AAC.7
MPFRFLASGQYLSNYFAHQQAAVDASHWKEDWMALEADCALQLALCSLQGRERVCCCRQGSAACASKGPNKFRAVLQKKNKERKYDVNVCAAAGKGAQPASSGGPNLCEEASAACVFRESTRIFSRASEKDRSCDRVCGCGLESTIWIWEAHCGLHVSRISPCFIMY